MDVKMKVAGLQSRLKAVEGWIQTAQEDAKVNSDPTVKALGDMYAAAQTQAEQLSKDISASGATEIDFGKQVEQLGGVVNDILQRADRCPMGMAPKKADAADCPVLKARNSGDTAKLMQTAKDVISQNQFGDDSFKRAQAVLEEALQSDPTDATGEINTMLGKAHFLQEHYGDAKKHLEVAVDRDPGNQIAKDMLARAERNIATKIEKPLSKHNFFDADELAKPPVLHLRKPDGLKPMVKEEMSIGGMATAAMRKVGGVVLGSVINAGVKVAGAFGTNSKDTPWTNWYTRPGVAGTMTLGAMREWLNDNTLESTYQGNLVGNQQPGQKKPEWTDRYRTATGAWTTNDPMEGAAGTEFQHQGTEGLAARKNRAEDPSLPSAREVSRAMLQPIDGKRVEAPFLNNLAIAWIQFQNHDWVSHGENRLDETYKVPLKEDDPLRQKYGQENLFVRKTQENVTRDDGKLANVNEVTHWWDGSQIYGSDQETQDRLRMGADGAMLADGKMRLTEDGDLPLSALTGVEDSGFTRNWWVGLDIFHTLFVKNHNSICDELKASGECEGWSTDQMFNTARLINAAVMAKIHTVEWTPAVLPNEKLTQGMGANWAGLLETWTKPVEDRKANNGMDVEHPILGGIVGGKKDNHGSPYGLSEKFVEVYRLHAGLPEHVHMKGLDGEDKGDVHLDETRAQGARQLNQKYGMDVLINSFGNQKMNALVNNNLPEFMGDMSIDGQAVFDLGTVDILRARERGVPPYNEFRESLGLKPIEKFEDLGCDAATVARLKELYGDDGVDKMDMLVGCNTEAIRPDHFGFGETLFQVFIQMASRRLEADPFYTEKFTPEYYTHKGMELIQQSSMKSVFLEHYPQLAETGLDGVNNAFEPWGTTAETHPEEHPLTAHAEKYRKKKK
jgi:hypothetical protein